MKLFHIFLFLFLFCFSVSLPALDINKAFHQYVHENIQIKDGLPQNSVYTIRQTNDGYIWFGTMEGLVRFDGQDFTVYDSSEYDAFKGNWIWTLYEDSNNRLWAGTYNNGAVIIEKESEDFGLNFNLLDKENGLSGNSITSIIEDHQKNIWIGTLDGGLNRISGKDITHFHENDGLSDERITALFEDNKGTLWIGTKKGGLTTYKNSFLNPAPLKGIPADFQVRSITADKQGNIMVSTDIGLLVIDSDKNYKIYSRKNGLTNESINQTFEDSNGNIWIGTYGGGLVRFNNGNFETFTKDDGLSSDVIISIFEDNEKNLWIGTLGGGVSKFKDGKVITYSDRDGLPKGSVLAVYEDSLGKLWVGSEGSGLYYFENGSFRKFHNKEFSSIENTVFSIAEDAESNIWVSLLDNGIAKISDDKIVRYSDDILSDKNILAVFRDSRNRMWLGTNFSGINLYENGTFKTLSVKNGLSDNRVSAFAEDEKGNIWIGTSKGLNIYDGKNINKITVSEGLSNDEISALYIDDDDNAWVGTFGGGLNLIRNGKITPFTKKDGLADNAVYAILEDNSGYLWTSSNKGLAGIEKKSLLLKSENRNVSLKIEKYGLSDGMASFECNGGFQPAGVKTKDGKLWFPTINGLVSVNPENIIHNSTPPSVNIEKIIRNREKITVKNNSSFLPGTKELEIKYTGISFSDSSKIKFKYILQGFDSEWVDADSRRTAYYTNLPPGEYIFKVSAFNSDGVSSSEPATFKFVQKPYFYQQTVCQIAISLILVFLIFLYVKLRTSAIKARNEKLQEMIIEKAKELTETQNELENVNIELRQKYETYRIDDDTAEKMLEELKVYMEKEKPYKNSAVTMQDVADAVNLSPHNLSQIINLHLNRNFYNFINDYRIEEAKKMLKNPEYESKTILEIAYESGFNAKTTFNSVFKKQTGMTPSQFRK